MDITTEDEMLRELRKRGRFLEFDFESPDCDDDGVFTLKETPDGDWNNAKVIGIVSAEAAQKWTEENYGGENYGPWCSTWFFPEFWPWPRK